MRIVGAFAQARRPGDTIVQKQLGSLYRRMLRTARTDPIEIADLAIDGDDLRRDGIPAGPVLGKILKALLEAVLEDPSHNTRDWLLQEARRMAGE
jgi:hypothetical protein